MIITTSYCSVKLELIIIIVISDVPVSDFIALMCAFFLPIVMYLYISNELKQFSISVLYMC